MMILAIDPGIATGYALLDTVSGDLIESEKIPIDRVAELSRFQREPEIFQVVIEQVPIPTGGQLSRSLFHVVSLLARVFPSAKIIRPAQWKPHPASRVPTEWRKKF